MSAEKIVANAQQMDGLLVSLGNRFDDRIISALPDSVRIIASFSVGVDHIDLAAAGARGITVTNTPDVLTDATADIAMLLLLGAARRAGEAHMMVMNNEWHGWATEFMLGKDLTDANLAILGMGRIGRAVARRARSFGMKIHYHNRTQLAEDLENGAVYHKSLESLLSAAEFLSLHAASTAQTLKIVNRRNIELMPDGAVIVNTARGDLVDDEALIEALRNHRISAAGLDVFDGEPNIHPDYRSLRNVFLLPHLGSATVNTRNAMGFRALDNLDAFFNGEIPRDRIV